MIQVIFLTLIAGKVIECSARLGNNAMIEHVSFVEHGVIPLEGLFNRESVDRNVTSVGGAHLYKERVWSDCIFSVL